MTYAKASFIACLLIMFGLFPGLWLAMWSAFSGSAVPDFMKILVFGFGAVLYYLMTWKTLREAYRKMKAEEAE